MSDSQVSIADLKARYGIVRSGLYARLKSLGIKPVRQGSKSYVPSGLLPLLDELDAFLKLGGTGKEFADLKGVGAPPDIKSASAPFNPLEYLRALEEACAKGWILREREVAQLLGIAQLPQGESFTDAGFVFLRSGTRADGQPAWRVTKFVAQAAA